jgi:uncharacterized Tic20 family protein
MTTLTQDSQPIGDIPPPLPPQTCAQPSNDRLWSVLCHLSFFFGLALLSFLFPLTVYLVMRTDSEFVTRHAREALNFHLSLLVYAICCIPLCFIVVGIPLLVALATGGVVCSVVAAVKASKGLGYEYPLSIRFVR